MLQFVIYNTFFSLFFLYLLYNRKKMINFALQK